MGREAVPALDVALAGCGTGSVAASIAQVLGKIDAAEATDALLARLDHPEPEVRREVIHTLRRRPLAPDAVRTEALLVRFRREVDGAALIDAALADLERCPEAQELVRTLQHQLERQLEMTLGLTGPRSPAKQPPAGRASSGQRLRDETRVCDRDHRSHLHVGGRAPDPPADRRHPGRRAARWTRRFESRLGRWRAVCGRVRR
jgi:hypothetical protein